MIGIGQIGHGFIAGSVAFRRVMDLYLLERRLREAAEKARRMEDLKP